MEPHPRSFPLFFKGAGKDFIAISIHVDDETIIARSLPPVIDLKLTLANRFGIDDLGETTYTLGLEVQRHSASGRLLLSQKMFVITTILERFSKYVPPLFLIPLDPAAGAALSKRQSPENQVRARRHGGVFQPAAHWVPHVPDGRHSARPRLFPVKIVEFQQQPRACALGGGMQSARVLATKSRSRPDLHVQRAASGKGGVRRSVRMPYE